MGRLLGAILLLGLLFAGVWFERAPLLRDAADLWIVSDPVTRADAVAVLGGGVDTRPFVAAELYKKGLVTRVLVSQVIEGRASNLGLIPGHTELNRMVLSKLGVPETAIENFGQANGSTEEEAAALRGWAEQHHVSRIIIPTEIFSARRVRWVFNREFGESPVRLKIAAFEPGNYTRAEWWKSKGGIIDFQNEFLKYLYYRVKY